ELRVQLRLVHEGSDVDELAFLGVGKHGGRLGDLRQIWWLAALDTGLEHGLVTRADAVDLDRDAGRRLEVGDRIGEARCLAAGPLCLDRDLLALERLAGAERLVELRVASRNGGKVLGGRSRRRRTA